MLKNWIIISDKYRWIKHIMNELLIILEVFNYKWIHNFSLSYTSLLVNVSEPCRSYVALWLYVVQFAKTVRVDSLRTQFAHTVCVDGWQLR
jgi:hypothetical protein